MPVSSLIGGNNYLYSALYFTDIGVFYYDTSSKKLILNFRFEEELKEVIWDES